MTERSNTCKSSVKERQTYRQKERTKERKSDRQTDRHTERKEEIKRERETKGEIGIHTESMTKPRQRTTDIKTWMQERDEEIHEI